MKQAILFCLFAFVSIRVSAQTIAVGSIAKLNYCAGDTMIVPYQASGTFAGDNSFNLQLSDSDGSFVTFVNFGHETGMTGSFKVPMMAKETRRRVRAASTDPYLVSVDNGNDISVLGLPTPSIKIRRETTGRVYGSGGIVGFGGEQFTVMDATNESPGSIYLWQFDSASGITPTTDSVAHITFPTEGSASVTLRVTNTNGCASSSSAGYTLLSCNPEIPKDAHIVTGSESTGGSASGKVIVVKTGGNLVGPTKWQTIFAEPGSSVALSALSGGFVYLKPGASFSCQGGNVGADDHLPVIVMTPERQVVVDNVRYQYDTLYCPDMTFGTSQLSGNPPSGQTIAVGSLPTLTYRLGDTMTVPYQARGTFGDGNFFALQLSGVDGSFNSFTTVGRDTLLTGQIAFPLGATGNHFRVRVASCDPYLASADNGRDISTLTSTVSESPAEGIDIVQISDHLILRSVESVIAAHLFSLLGTELLSQRGTGTLDIDLSQIPAGIYFAVIESGERREARKIAVLH